MYTRSVRFQVLVRTCAVVVTVMNMSIAPLASLGRTVPCGCGFFTYTSDLSLYLIIRFGLSLIANSASNGGSDGTPVL